jgi:hypothetical protein
MNRAKKEEARKRAEARKGLSPEEVEILDAADAIEEKVEELAREIHARDFPEEYDFMGDSSADAKDRRKGSNPMAADYIAEVQARRTSLGVSPLDDNGMAVSNETYQLCLERARRQVYAEPDLKRPPAERCIICEKRLEEVGGRRLAGQHSISLFISEKPMGGGNAYLPYRSVKLSDEPEYYLVSRGHKGLWTDQLLEKATSEFQSGRRPWFCQVCGHRTCSECRTPLPAPVGSDIVYPDGSTAHVPILGGNPGCSNPDCSRYREQYC